MQGADTWVYTYDPANRLKEVKKNSTVLGTYSYDANGIRAKKVEGGQTTHYLALGHKNLYEKTGTVATKHIFAGTKRIAEVRDGVVSYYHNDHLGSPRAVTNTSGTFIASTGTRPFGQPHSTNNPTDYLFTGKELDDTGLYYFAARYYNPSVGRFVTEDRWQGRLEEPWTKNRYVYVGNNPLKYVDPTGNVPQDLLCSGGAAAITVGAAQHGSLKYLLDAAYYSGMHIISSISNSISHNASAIVNYFSSAGDKVGGNSSGNAGGSGNLDPFEDGGRSAYDIAKDGGKQSGTYKQYVSKSTKEIQKGINSFSKQIEQHKSKIANPEKHISGWENLDPRHQQDLIHHHWPRDIQRLQELREILQGILRER